MSALFFARAGRAGPQDIGERMPELSPMRSATIALFGLGALGSVSALEFARSEAGDLRVLDYDFVDPATVGRWVFGLQAAGLPKAKVIADAVRRDYPFTQIKEFIHCIGAVRDPQFADTVPSEQAVMRGMTAGASLIYDATAEVGVQHYLSDYAAALGIPYVSVDASPGAWGGRIVSIVPGKTQGCWVCYQYSLDDGKIPDVPMHPDGEVQPIGCANPTFTGAGFDLVQVAITGVRVAVSVLCAGTAGAYPQVNWDVTTVAFRSADGRLILPASNGYVLTKHPRCKRCSP